jgi:hypothetical protein
MAVGRLAELRCPNHRQAKRVARAWQRLWGPPRPRCHRLPITGYDMTTDHAAFIKSGIWRDVCMRQLEYAVDHLGSLGDPGVWNAEVRSILRLDTRGRASQQPTADSPQQQAGRPTSQALAAADR